MADKSDKQEFINYILSKKYSREPKDAPIHENAIKSLENTNIETGLMDTLMKYSSEFTKDEGVEFFINLNKKIQNIQSKELMDIIFGMIYANPTLTKLIKDKTVMDKIGDVINFYKERFQENKLILKDYNSKDQGKMDIGAPKKNVVTRFPPEPSGYLHIGHAKAALLNWYFSNKSNGQLLVRFDDTNPDKEKTEYESAILEDLKTLGITDYKLSHSSDHFDKIFEMAIFLIKEGKAYADNTPLEQMRKERGDGIESKCRNTPVDKNLEIFEKMRNGEVDDYCLRAKIDMSNPNKAMRDPVIYRVNKTPHHYTGTKYKTYPTYDFTCPVVDSIEGVTISLRTNEYRDRNAQYYWFLENLKLENKPKIHDFSRLNFENTVLSKRKLKFYVENNYVTGWDDPRFATVRGIKRLGMNMDALREYILMQGVSQKTSTISWDKIWAINKKTIDPLSSRFSAVKEKDFVDVTVEGTKEYLMDVPKHKKNPSLGVKKVFYSKNIILSQEDAKILEDNEEFTLMNWGNAIVKEKVTSGDIVKSMKVILNLEGDFKTTKNKISWISKMGAITVKFYEYGNLINNEDSDDPAKIFNKDSKHEEFWLVENSVKDVKEGETLQFERIGFYYCDGFSKFNLIPFTKQKRTIN